MRPIDADKLNVYKAWVEIKTDDGAVIYAGKRKIVLADDVADAPAVDPVKHGYWIMKPNGYGTCSNCKTCELDIGGGVDSDYCPNCGAKMTLD